jgi:hypothetical protein
LSDSRAGFFQRPHEVSIKAIADRAITPVGFDTDNLLYAGLGYGSGLLGQLVGCPVGALSSQLQQFCAGGLPCGALFIHASITAFEIPTHASQSDCNGSPAREIRQPDHGITDVRGM